MSCPFPGTCNQGRNCLCSRHETIPGVTRAANDPLKPDRTDGRREIALIIACWCLVGVAAALMTVWTK